MAEKTYEDIRQELLLLLAEELPKQWEIRNVWLRYYDDNKYKFGIEFRHISGKEYNYNAGYYFDDGFKHFDWLMYHLNKKNKEIYEDMIESF